MTKPQLTKVEAMYLLENNFCLAETRARSISVTYENMEKNGYIVRTAVEEAEEMFQNWNDNETNVIEVMELIRKQHHVINYLKEQISEVQICPK